MSDDFFLCYFETTRRCNLNCPYCMSRPLNGRQRPELDTDECRRLVLDEIRAVSSNAAVAFSGGEHLLRPDAYELIEYAASLGLWSFVNTNGRLLVETDAIERALAAAGGRIIFVLPLNSVDAEVNRYSRDDGIETVLAAAEACRSAGAEFFYILTVSRHNLASLQQTMRFLKLNRVPLLRAPFVPRGAGALHREFMFDRADMRDCIHPALTGNPLAYVSFTPFFAAPERISEIWRRLGVRIRGLGCQAARTFTAVGAEGGVTPCVQLLDSGCECGNVRTQRFSEMVAHHPLFQALRTHETLKGKCGRCRYRQTCGGCRALAYYMTGDILAEDPTCFFEPASEAERCPLEAEQTAQLGRFIEYVKYNEPWNLLF